MYQRVEAGKATTGIFLCLTWISFLLRCRVRAHLVNRLGWDDLTMLFAMTLFTVFGSLLISLSYLFENRTIDSNASAGREFAKMNLATGVCYFATLLCVRFSISTSFLHFVANRLQRNIVYAVLIVSTLDNVGNIFTVIFTCGMPDHLVDRYYKHECLSTSAQMAILYQQTIIAIVTNGTLASLASFIVWKTKSRDWLNCKAILATIFMLIIAWLATIAPIIRVCRTGQLFEQRYSSLNSDVTTIWVVVETGTLLMAGCLMTLGPLFKHGTIRDNTAKFTTSSRRSISPPCQLSPETPQNPYQTSVTHPHVTGIPLPKNIIPRRDDTVSFQKAASNHDWDPRAWEDNNPRRKAKTTTTCTGGFGLIPDSPSTPHGALKGKNYVPLRETSFEQLMPWKKPMKSTTENRSMEVMKTVAVDLEESIDVDSSIEALEPTMKSGIDSRRQQSMMGHANLPKLWPYEEDEEKGLG